MMRHGILGLIGGGFRTDRGAAAVRRRRQGDDGRARRMIERFEPRLLMSGGTAETVPLPGEWGTARAIAPAVATTVLAASPAEAGSAGESPLPPPGDSNVVNGIVYSNLAEASGGGYVVFGDPAGGELGVDDYNSINDANIAVGEFIWVGDVDVAGGSLTFEFQNAAGGVVGSFSAVFPNTDPNFWQVPVPSGFTIPDAGRLRVIAPAGVQGRWFLTDADPTIGTQDPGFGGFPPFYSHTFELFNGSATAPDLQPAALAGRTDPITISTTTGSGTDAAQIPAGSSVFVDYGWGNFGDAAAGSFTTRLRLDGVVVDTQVTGSLDAGFGALVPDLNLGAVAAGLHTLTVEVDTGNTVDELQLEGNNAYSRQFFVGTPANGTVSGFKWNDTDSDGVKDGGEPVLSGWTIFADLNGNGSPDGGEPSDVTDAAGAYELTNLPTGVYTIREVLQPGFTQTFPGAAGRSNHDFEIEVIYPDDTLTPSQKAAFVTAADRWEEIIKGDVPDLFIAGLLVDDVRIEASGPFIDGPSQILGAAGPRLLRPGSLLPVTGIMRFDSADLADLEADGALVDVILHEMGHVLGIGGLWQAKGLLSGAGTSNPRYHGPNALAEFNALFHPDQASVPVANTGGAGSADSHWRESVMFNELMTPGYNGGMANPISRITIGSLEDLGYAVDYDAADPYAAPGPSEDTYAGEPLDGYFVGLDEEPVIVQSGAISGSGGAVAFAHEVHLDPGEAVSNINFGNAGATPAPRVTDVFVAGSGWSTAFRDRLQASGDGEAAFGYRIKPEEQTRTLGWSNLNQVSIRFSEHVNVAADDLVINGVNVASYGYVVAPSPFYDPATFTATWTLDRLIPNDKLTLNLDGDAGTGVTGAASGGLLDGEWTNPVHPSFSGDTFPSGNGSAGGDFVFNLRVLPGDVNRDGAVGVADLNLVKFNFGQSDGDLGQGDLNASNLVDLADLNTVKINFGKTAPV